MNNFKTSTLEEVSYEIPNDFNRGGGPSGPD